MGKPRCARVALLLLIISSSFQFCGHFTDFSTKKPFLDCCSKFGSWGQSHSIFGSFDLKFVMSAS